MAIQRDAGGLPCRGKVFDDLTQIAFNGFLSPLATGKRQLILNHFLHFGDIDAEFLRFGRIPQHRQL